jgi:hypothetical protein
MFLKIQFFFVLYEDIDNEVRIKYQCHIDDDKQATCVMLASMILELQTQYENMDVHIIIMYLKELFYVTSRTKSYETSKELFHCKMAKGSSMNTYLLRMIDYFKKLDHLNFVMDLESSVDLVLQSKHKSVLGASRMTRELITIM